MAICTQLTERIAEAASARITAQVTDLDGNGFQPQTLTLLLYDAATGDVLNNRNRVSILNTGGGTITGTGELAIELSPADNVLVSDRREENHIALVEWTWSAGTRAGRHEIHFTVRNFDRVPAA